MSREASLAVALGPRRRLPVAMAICSTISKDNTAGEEARRADLFAYLGRKTQSNVVRLHRHRLLSSSLIEDDNEKTEEQALRFDYPHSRCPRNQQRQQAITHILSSTSTTYPSQHQAANVSHSRIEDVKYSLMEPFGHSHFDFDNSAMAGFGPSHFDFDNSAMAGFGPSHFDFDNSAIEGFGPSHFDFNNHAMAGFGPSHFDFNNFDDSNMLSPMNGVRQAQMAGSQAGHRSPITNHQPDLDLMLQACRISE